MFSLRLFRASSACQSITRPNGLATELRRSSYAVVPKSQFSCISSQAVRSYPSRFSRAIPRPRADHKSFSSAPPRALPPRYDYRHAQNARPLITPQQIGATVRHPFTLVIVGVCITGGTVFYFTHIEEVPVSGRRRFNCVTPAQAAQEGEAAFHQILDQEASQGKILPPRDSRVKMVKRVLGRLIEGAQLADGATWEVRVIEEPGNINAFVLPGGKVFVYTGILPIAQDDNGLAAVLGHEIAHNLANHSGEKMSSLMIIQPLLFVLRVLDDSGYFLGLGRLVFPLLLDLGIMRPASREQESEADYIGLLLMAQSCYDPHAAVGLWQRMEEAQKNGPPEWLSTHPSNQNRIKRMTEWLPKAEEARLESGCAPMIGYSQAFNSFASSLLPS